MKYSFFSFFFVSNTTETLRMFNSSLWSQQLLPHVQYPRVRVECLRIFIVIHEQIKGWYL